MRISLPTSWSHKPYLVNSVQVCLILFSLRFTNDGHFRFVQVWCEAFPSDNFTVVMSVKPQFRFQKNTFKVTEKVRETGNNMDILETHPKLDLGNSSLGKENFVIRKILSSTVLTLYVKIGWSNFIYTRRVVKLKCLKHKILRIPTGWSLASWLFS